MKTTLSMSMEDKNIFTQDEINNMKLNEAVPPDIEVKNLIILMRNELNTLETQVSKCSEKFQTKISKKLNKILNSIIEIRKE